MNELSAREKALLKLVKRLTGLIIFLVIAMVVLTFVNITGLPALSSPFPPSSENAAALVDTTDKAIPPIARSQDLWHAPNDNKLYSETNDELLEYGKELVANTSLYFGPHGKIASITNGMNCQNCHLQAGTIPFGNNYGAVFSTYPKYRARSGMKEDIYKRITDCFERSLNGAAPAHDTKEMQAMAAYINWVGKTVTKAEKPKGSGIYELTYMDRAADTVSGRLMYRSKCQSCHQADGKGQLNPQLTAYLYPPLWGEHSYNTGAGLNRLSRLAGYIKANMPFGASYNAPQLTDEESWDIGAYIASMPRPHKVFEKDWPKLKEKPIDHPFGPYVDNFSEAQHKYGPFKPIKAELEKLKKQKSS